MDATLKSDSPDTNLTRMVLSKLQIFSKIHTPVCQTEYQQWGTIANITQSKPIKVP